MPINLVRQRKSSGGFFSEDSKLLYCLSCIKIDSFQKYFDVTTEEVKERLNFAVLGHFKGMKRPNKPGQHGLDYDLYVPLWMMITLIVECSIIGYTNDSITNFFKSKKEVHALTENYTMSTVSNLFFFMAFFFTLAPAGVYLFARIKLLDGETHFLKLFSALGYSYASYVPAIALTLIHVGTLKWLFIALALCN